MKKILVPILILMVFVISCSSSKKAENDTDILPDEDAADADVDVIDENSDLDEEAATHDENNDELNDTDEDKTENINPCNPNPCEEIKNSTGKCWTENAGQYSCDCIKNYFWNWKECINPCDGVDCRQIEHAVGECKGENAYLFRCGCDEGYFWDGGKCVNPCENVSCGQIEHASGECKVESLSIFICDCDDDFYWHTGKKKCLKKTENICTGQTKCYDNKKEFSCPDFGEKFFGQDAQYADLGFCTPQSFSIDETVSNEPVVIDNNTELQWQQTFQESNKSNANRYCEDLTYGGYDDWRLPTVLELQSIVDKGKFDPAANTAYFPDTSSKCFWASSTSALCENNGGPHGTFLDCDNTYYDWCVDFATGLSHAYSQNKTEYVRCVRGENLTAAEFAESNIFIGTNKQNAEIVFNSKGTLIWQAEFERYNWANALKYCEELELAGLSDWRLPNKNELLNAFPPCSTYFLDYYMGYDHGYYNSQYYWSSTSVYENPNQAWIVNRGCTGKVSLDNYSDKTNSNFVLCVTDNPCKDGTIWNGETCIKENPCESKSISCDRRCIVSAQDKNGYYCQCFSNNQTWNSNSLKCTKSCKSQPCEGKAHSTGECFDDDFEGYYCGCEEGYSWMKKNGYYGCYED